MSSFGPKDPEFKKELKEWFDEKLKKIAEEVKQELDHQQIVIDFKPSSQGDRVCASGAHPKVLSRFQKKLMERLWFVQMGASPYMWWREANDLRVAAKQVGILAVNKMLFGMSMECLLKGVRVTLDRQYREEAATGKVAGGNHDLCNLACDVAAKQPILKITSKEERCALKELSSFIRWIGRYPIPLEASDMLPVSDSSNNPRNAIWDRFEAYLRLNGWGLQSDGSWHPMPETQDARLHE